MKIKRFVAKDMRTALLEIKEELGADAVIMSNKKIPEGVELMAAIDYGQSPAQAKQPEQTPKAVPETVANRKIDNDVVSIGQQAGANGQASAPADSLSALLTRNVQQPTQSAVADPVSDIELQFKNFTDRLEQNAIMQDKGQENKPQETSQPYQASETNRQPAAKPSSATSAYEAQQEIEKMRQEMSSIRQLLEHQVSGLMWQDMAQRDPSRAVLVNRLMSMGITEQISDQVASYIPNNLNEQQSWAEAKKLITQQINTTSNDIIHRGGVVSLVGPTGVGKTTTIAKLAARFAQIHGPENVALISTDSYRIAGFEQLATYGKIIGCQVKLAKDSQALDMLLQQFSKKKLVLIDTAGMGQRDMRLADHLATLVGNARVRIRNYLVLAANSQQRVMQENVQRFKKIPLAGCIYTKLDESLSVGEIIATAIQNGLPIGYLTDGQRVPEDIKVANAEKLVTLAERMAAKTNNQPIGRPMPSAAVV